MVDKRRPKGGVEGDGGERTKGSERKSSNRSVGDFSYPKVSFVVFPSFTDRTPLPPAFESKLIQAPTFLDFFPR